MHFIEADFRRGLNMDASLPFFQQQGVDPEFIRKLMITWDMINRDRENLYYGTRVKASQDLTLLADIEQRLKDVKKIRDGIRV